MTQTKMSPCCARRVGQVHHEEGNLAKLARKAASHQARNRDLTRLKELIADAKEAVAQQRQALIDHEATHAGTPA